MEEGGVEVREMGVGDFGVVQEVARITWAETYRGIIPEDEQASFVERAYSEEALRHRMQAGVFLVAVLGGEVVGFADFDPDPGKPGEVSELEMVLEIGRNGG